LNGVKGAGKTQLARLVACKAATQAIPCIIVNQPWSGDKFNRLIQSIAQPCIILFDEFEKVYDRDIQPEVLTLLDGVFPTKKLFIMTCNDQWLIDDHMRNRPGRIYYLIDFRGLEQKFIREYCDDKLINRQHASAICKIAEMFNEFNFDMLQAIVEEVNRYGETPEQALVMLNSRPTTDNDGDYTIVVTVDGRQLTVNQFYPNDICGSPLKLTELEIRFDNDQDEKCDTDPSSSRKFRPRTRSGDQSVVRITQQHLAKFDAHQGKFLYEVADQGVIVEFTRVRHAIANYMRLLA
jgi:hypothetical protein